MSALAKISVRSLASLLIAATLLCGTAQAQTPDRVGRIAHVAGDVQFYSESEQAWLPAQLNAPVSSRNSVYTGQDGRAEIRFGSSAVSLDADTQLDIQVLDDNRFKADVPRGSVSLRVREIEGDESYEVSAPGASYEVLQAGRYRVDTANDGSSVTVLAGLVNAAVAGGGSAMVEAGHALSAANGGFERSAARRNGLDRWAEQRDNAYRSSQSARYVSPNMTGYEELDANGRWASDPDYGNVWYPTTHVSVDWVPYRDGRWAYVAPWGWTWIDAAPWGFAPFHYGRWVLIGPRWAWMPGTYVRRPSYAPALVGFIGGSTAVSISIGTRPAVGWYPLPPWEHYRPAYAHHDRHRHNINNFSISKPPSHAWRTVDNRRVSVNQVQGSTVVPRDAFVGSRPVRRAAMAVSAPMLVAPQVATAPVAAPTRSLTSSAPAGNARPEFGDRRGARDSDQGRGDRQRGNAGSGTPITVAPRAADVAPSATMAPSPSPANGERRPGFSRGESRREERQVQPAVAVPQPAPQARESAAPAAVGSAPAVPPAQMVNPEQRRSARDESWETRRQERRPPPAVVAPQNSQPLPAPRIDSPPPQSDRSFASRSAPAAPVVQRRDEGRRDEGRRDEGRRDEGRRDEGRRSDMPAAGGEAMRQSSPRIASPEAAAPRQRAEPPAVRVEPRSEPRTEPRVERRVEPRPEQRSEPRPEPRVERRVEPRPEQRPEPRIEPRAQPRVEPRVEPRPEPRQVQRVEPPPQREQKRAPEPERERRPRGEGDKDK